MGRQRSDSAVRLAAACKVPYLCQSRTGRRTISIEFGATGGPAMPVYEYHCDKCKRDVRVTLSISAHDQAKVGCPRCGSKALRPLVSTFFSQTSRKS
jgi:putative FmdB family regulatory protein